MSKEMPVFHDWHHAFDDEFERKGEIKGFTKKQRDWIIRMWDTVFNAPPGYHVCGFPIIKGEKFYLHGFVKEIHLHHCMPKNYAWRVLGWDEKKINSPENAIPLCPKHHLAKGLVELDYYNEPVPAIHIDMEIARRHYQGNNHPTSYDQAFEWRRELMRRGEIYWNPDWDMALTAKIKEVYHRYLNWQLEHHGEYIDIFTFK